MEGVVHNSSDPSQSRTFNPFLRPNWLLIAEYFWQYLGLITEDTDAIALLVTDGIYVSPKVERFPMGRVKQDTKRKQKIGMVGCICTVNQ
jgi:hypothetical protein